MGREWGEHVVARGSPEVGPARGISPGKEFGEEGEGWAMGWRVGRCVVRGLCALWRVWRGGENGHVTGKVRSPHQQLISAWGGGGVL